MVTKLKYSLQSFLIGLTFIGPLFLSSVSHADIKACIYYDEPVSNFKFGEVHAIMLKNLFGHFKEVKTSLQAIQNYSPNDLSKCDRVAYIGSYYNSTIPEIFYLDLLGFAKPVLWMGYNFWNLQAHWGEAETKAKFGFTFLNLFQTDEPPQRDKVPGFFQYFEYKGQKYHKLNFYNSVESKQIGAFEIGLVQNQQAEVLSYAIHNKTGQKTPYILRNKNYFFVADVPFVFIHEADRYLILTDVMFDFLKLEPRLKIKPAIARIEDIHPEFDPKLIYRSVEIFKRLKIPFTMTVIPMYVDQFGYRDGRVYSTTLKQKPEMVKALKYAVDNGGSIIIHGYMHTVEGMINCDSGATGDDFEFWDECHETPLKIESKSWVTKRLNKAKQILEEVGLPYVGWLPPHYEASPLAYKTFAENFSLTLQRVRYIPDSVDPFVMKKVWAGQFFPYIIERDYYGQKVYPENLGDVCTDVSEIPNLYAKSEIEVREMIDLNSVIRDGWASFFWHPQYYNNKESLDRLERTIKYIQQKGFTFVQIPM